MPGAQEERAAKEEDTVAGSSYMEINEDETTNVSTAVVIRRQDNVASYSAVNHMYNETWRALEQVDVLMKYDFVLYDKKQQLVMVKRADGMATGLYEEEFVEVGVMMTDMISCMALELGERERWATVILELVAAAQAYEEAVGVATKISFKENMRQYGRYWRRKSALGIDGGTDRLVSMLEALRGTSYGKPKYFQVQAVDTGGHVDTVKFSMGARTTAV